jgi:hypothetical protein
VSRTYLWHIEGLDAARHVYEKAGFRLAAERLGSRGSFGCSANLG